MGWAKSKSQNRGQAVSGSAPWKNARNIFGVFDWLKNFPKIVKQTKFFHCGLYYAVKVHTVKHLDFSSDLG